MLFYCCYTGPGITEESEFDLYVEEVYNYTRSVQQPDGSWEDEFSDYVATHFITNIDYPSIINGNTDVPITVSISLPEYSEYYDPNEVLHARTDVQLNTGGAFIFNNVIDIRVEKLL